MPVHPPFQDISKKLRVHFALGGVDSTEIQYVLKNNLLLMGRFLDAQGQETNWREVAGVAARLKALGENLDEPAFTETAERLIQAVHNHDQRALLAEATTFQMTLLNMGVQ